MSRKQGGNGVIISAKKHTFLGKIGSGVSVGEGVGNDDALVKADFTSLGFFDLDLDLEWIVHGSGSWFFQRFGDFVDDVGFETIKVQLGLPARVEGESAFLAFHFSVAVIPGASASKLDDVIPGFQFAGKFAAIITCWWHRLG